MLLSLVLCFSATDEVYTSAKQYSTPGSYSFYHCSFESSSTDHNFLAFIGSGIRLNIAYSHFNNINVTGYGAIYTSAATSVHSERCCFTGCRGVHTATYYCSGSEVTYDQNYEYDNQHDMYGMLIGATSKCIVENCNFSYGTGLTSSFGPNMYMLPENNLCRYFECRSGKSGSVFAVCRDRSWLKISQANILNNTMGGKPFATYYDPDYTSTIAIVNSFVFGNSETTLGYCTMTGCYMDFESPGNTCVEQWVTCGMVMNNYCYNVPSASFTSPQIMLVHMQFVALLGFLVVT